MSAKLTVETEQTVELDPDVSARLAAELETYQALKVDADLLYEQMDKQKAAIWALMQEAGVKKLRIDGVPVSWVEGTTSKLDKAKFVELGGSLTQLENATVTKPKKGYLDVG